MGDSDDRDTIPSFDDVMSAARRWYYSEIRDLATEAIKECLSRRGCPNGTSDERREWLTEWVDETTDGHEYVIYTAKAGMALAASDNDGAYESEIGESGTVEARACFAMRVDVWQLLDARSDEWESDEDDNSGAEAEE